MKSIAMNRTINFHQVRNSKWFDAVIHHLKSKYTIISAGDLERSISSGEPFKKTCHLTFDDGDISFYNIVLPVLRKYMVPATLFVSPRICRERINFWFQDIAAFDLFRMKREISTYTGIPAESIMKISTISLLKSLPYDVIKGIMLECSKKQQARRIPFRNVNVQQLMDINRSGLVTIGAHTLNHPILKNEDDKTSRYEISRSIIDLTDLLGQEVRYFAYPNGIALLDYAQREKDYVRECNISLAFENESDETVPSDTMSIPRIALSDGESMSQIELKLRFPGLWYSLKRFNPSGEYRERMRLSTILTAIH